MDTILDVSTIKINYGDEEHEDITTLGDWRNVIFVPFDLKWETLLICSVMFSTMTSIYDVLYEPQNAVTFFLSALYYVDEVLYFVDTVFCIMHRNMKQHAKLRAYKPRNLLALSIDVITLIPFYETFEIISEASYGGNYNAPFKKQARLKVVPRMYRVYLFFHVLRHTAGLSQIIVVVSQHFVFFVVFSHTAGALWNALKCWRCGIKNWTVNISYFLFHPTKPIHWLVVCYTYTANIFAHCSTGLIRGETSLETSFSMFMNLFGFINHIMIYNAILTAAFIKIFKKTEMFLRSLHGITELMREWNVPKAMISRVIIYHKEMWNQRHGCKDMPGIFYTLPISLQKEITLDLFWEAFRHSHIFAGMDIPFKRAISRAMKSEFYLAGEYLMRIKDRKNKIYFIVSGIIQVLSDEDDESPIISFSSGSLIGEVSGLMNCVNSFNVKCATYCELQTLNMPDVFRILCQGYRSRSQIIFKHIEERINLGKIMYSLKTEEVQAKQNDPEFVEQSSIKWLKTQWRLIADLQKHKNKLPNISIEEFVDPIRCSTYLDLYVISEDVELKIKAICLTAHLPFIMEPDSSARKAWDFIHLISIVVLSLILPYCAAFLRTIPRRFIFCYSLLYLITLMDVVIQMFTAIRLKGKMISQPTEILLYNFKKISFLVDLVASLPLAAIGYFVISNSHLLTILALSPVIKVYKIFIFVRDRESTLIKRTILYLFIKYTVAFLLICYWFTCLLFSMACFNPVCYADSFYVYNAIIKGTYKKPKVVLDFFFIYNYVATLFLVSGWSNLYEYTIKDIIMAHIITMAGYNLFSFYFAEQCATFVKIMSAQSRFNENISDFRRFMTHTGVLNSDLQESVLSYLKFQWNYNSDIDYGYIKNMFSHCSAEHRTKIFERRAINALKKIYLFQDCDEHFLRCVADKSKFKIMPPNTEIVTAGSRCVNMHIIIRGYIRHRSYLPGDKERKITTYLSEGDAFSVIECLHNVAMFTTVTSVTSVELISVERTILKDLFKAFPKLQAELSRALDNHLFFNRATLHRLGGRLPAMKPVEKSLGQGDYFTYEIYDDDQINREKIIFMKPFLALGKWKWLHYLLLRKTVNQTSKFYFTWEIFRAVMILLIFNLVLLSTILPDNVIIFYITLFLDLVFIPDFFIRLHCQYYNKVGLLITHPLFTARHYLTTNFPIDILYSIPFHLLGFSNILGHQNKPMLNVLIISMFRPIGLYRIFGLLSYFQIFTSWFLLQLVKLIKYFLVISVLVTLLAYLYFHLTCAYQGTVLICEPSSWLMNSKFHTSINATTVILFSYYLVILSITSATCGSFQLGSSLEATWWFILIYYGYVMKLFIISIMSCSGIVGNTNLLTYRTRVRAFFNFMDKELVSEDLVQLILKHYEYIWNKTKGQKIDEMLSKLHVQLHKDFALHLYGNTLNNVKFFDGIDHSFHNFLCTRLEHTYFMNGAEIIRCNDVQGKLFIVYKGIVEVQIAGTKIVSLCSGGVFGNFTRYNVIRQVITVTAKVHSELLTISGSEFHHIAQDYPMLISRLKETNSLRQEYSEPIINMLYDDSHFNLITAKLQKVTLNKWSMPKCYISSDNFWFKLYNYLLCVHLVPISCIIVIYLLAIHRYQTEYMKIIFMYVVDAFLLIKMIADSFVSYIDTETGLYITDRKLIREHYIGKYFFLEIFSIFPFELFVMIFMNNQIILKFLQLNRTGRMLFFERYYYNSKDKLNERILLKWIHLTYWILFWIQACSAVWWIVACYPHGCKMIENTGYYNKHTKHLLVKSKILSEMLAYSYVVNIFTATGVSVVFPVNIPQLIVTIIIALLSLYVTGVITSTFASILVIENSKMTQYEHKIDTLKQYLVDQKLSPIIVENTWNYLLLLWLRQNGEFTPKMIQNAPNYLKQDVLMKLYGKYLLAHPLFKNTHTDFLRQVSCHFKRYIFFPGNIIAEKGDIDGCMYFIHRGEIEEYEMMGNSSILIRVLTEGMCFGEGAGLYFRPHINSYRALTTVDVIVLKRSDWIYLLSFFPASNEEIEKHAYETGIKKKVRQKDYLYF